MKKLFKSNILLKILIQLQSKWQTMLYRFFMIFPIQRTKVVFTNYYGKGFGDNGKSIARKLMRKSTNDLVWLVKHPTDDQSIPEGIRAVRYDSWRAAYEQATAKVWVDNSRKLLHIQKRSGQIYIQTWHGGIALKKIEKDAERALSKKYVKMAKHDSTMVDYLVSNSSFCTDMYKRAFWYDGKILEVGSPRCDQLIQDTTKNRVNLHSYYNVPENTKFLLYAPTFRNAHNIDVYNIDFEKLRQVLTDEFEGPWCVLVRLHPNMSQGQERFSYSSYIKNATDFPDMYELMAGSDILITDYSSSMFEFSLTEKPVFLYARDIKEYTKERDFYFKLTDLPYPISTSNDELFQSVASFASEEYNRSVSTFYETIGLRETGNASKEVAKLIIEHIEGRPTP